MRRVQTLARLFEDVEICEGARCAIVQIYVSIALYSDGGWELTVSAPDGYAQTAAIFRGCGDVERQLIAGFLHAARSVGAPISV